MFTMADAALDNLEWDLIRMATYKFALSPSALNVNLTIKFAKTATHHTICQKETPQSVYSTTGTDSVSNCRLPQM